MSASDGGSKSCCTCARCILFLVILAILGAVGGVLAWLYIPGASDAVQDLAPPEVPIPTPPNNDNNNDNLNDDENAYPFNQCSGNDDDDCCMNGVDGLCDLRVDQVVWATVHNAASTRDDGTFLYPNHRYNVQKAMDAGGYRGVNLDVCNCDGQLVLCHGLCSVGTVDLNSVFATLVNFLNDNPSAVLLVTLELNSEVDGNVDLNAVEQQLASSVAGFSDQLYIHNQGEEWPTLRTMKELQQRMLLFHYRGPTNCSDGVSCPLGFHYWFSDAVETPFSFEEPQELLDSTNSCALDRGRTGRQAFFGVNAFTTLPDRDEAATINARNFLEAHLDACANVNNGLEPNVVIVDFWSVGDVIEVVQERNKARVAQQRRRRALGKV